MVSEMEKKNTRRAKFFRLANQIERMNNAEVHS